jgi:hypothetical protein
MSSPVDTPPVGRLGLWIGASRRIVPAERASKGRRLYLELCRGLNYRTNLGELTSVIERRYAVTGAGVAQR